MQSQTLAGLKAQLPVRVANSRVQRAAAIRFVIPRNGRPWGEAQVQALVRWLPLGSSPPALFFLTQ